MPAKGTGGFIMETKDVHPKAKLMLYEGHEFEGFSFGAPTSVSGEVVFTTGMVGYPESMTDPSFSGQILVITFPMVGNYGIPDIEKDAFGVTKNFESQDGKIHASAVVVSEYCHQPEHWQSVLTLDKWLKSQNVPGLMMVDTRSIVLKLREMGTALGKLVVDDKDVPFQDPNTRLLTDVVSTKEKRTYGHGNITILCLDMGIKLNIIRCFLRQDVTFVVVPHDHDITSERYDGLFVSNGPGNPEMCHETIRNLRWAIGQDKPIFGVCMGNQVLALAAGAKTYKMKYGHRGQNQPCRSTDGSVVITTQNHGFAVNSSSLPPDWEESYVNSNDNTNEGIRHKTKPISAVQFHPEGRCGPKDTEFLYRDFVEQVKKSKVAELTKWVPSKVLVLGAGGITIAQAGEFDYSGSQCLKSLREEGVETILINPNIATVQTDDEMADKIYFVPVTPEAVEKVIEQERPDGILLGWGGQTALNCGVKLDDAGVFKKYNVRVLGTQVSVIGVTEDRELFRDALLQINEHVADSEAVINIEAAESAAAKIGYPVMVRAAFCLGGQGSGIVADVEELRKKVSVALAASPQVLVERSVVGWKEIEYEVVRDIYDNCITVCNMENFDPMGVHTGESIVVAPSQTLTNDEYHMLRTASIKIIRHLGVVGECNVQYGLDPHSSRYVVIEVNARLSRSSALASKATGYPLAHVAAKLALGKGLPDIRNGVTKTTTACFEPSMDYCAVKMPRWDLNKFNMVDQHIGTMMKSVGEAMSIGRTFQEAIQKAIRMIDPSRAGFALPAGVPDDYDFEDVIRRPTPERLMAICVALHRGVTVQKIHDWSKINKFFLTKLEGIVMTEKYISATYKAIQDIPVSYLRQVKGLGFSDIHLANCLSTTEDEVRAYRYANKILPFVKQIDTVAGETAAQTNYLYTSHNAQEDDVDFGEKYYVVLGCGVYRIGNSVEFDYGGVLVARELRRLGHKVIMINYNPETVSTDYDECDRLYFEEVSIESILDILHKERSHGVVISVGGQIVQNLALKLKNSGVKILGTDPSNIDRAEDRNKFSTMCDEIGVGQPEWIAATSLEQVREFCKKTGFPSLIRPSYVLSGSAMSVISCLEDVDIYLKTASLVSGSHPVVVSKYYESALEYDVDVVAHNGKVLCYSICEHIESAGVHSGDATMFLPPQHPRSTHAVMKALYNYATKVAEKLSVVGPMNIQFLLTTTGELKVIEANIRCSRSVPFVSKTLGISFPAVMVSAFLSRKDQVLIPIKRAMMTHIGCKAGMFSFNRLGGADPILGVEMRSTGEVGVFGRDKHEVILKAMLCQNFKYPVKAALIACERECDAVDFAPYAKLLSQKLKLYGTKSTVAWLKLHGVDAETAYGRDAPGQQPQIDDMYEAKAVDLVVQLRDKTRDFLLRRCTAEEAPVEYWIRRCAVDFNISLITEIEIAKLFSESFVKFTPLDIEVLPFKTYVPKIYQKLKNHNCSLFRHQRLGLCVDDDLSSRLLALRLKSEELNLICFHADIGQRTEVGSLQKEFLNADIALEIIDLRSRMAQACFDVIMSNAVNDLTKWSILSIGRHVVSQGIVPAMKARKIDVCAQSSSRSSRESRFEKYVTSLCPEMGVYTPWRDKLMLEDFPTDEEKISYVKERDMKIPPVSKGDRTVWNMAGIGQYVADDKVQESVLSPLLVKSMADCSNDPEFVTVTFKQGACVMINGLEANPIQAMQMCNDLGARNGLGLEYAPDGSLFEAPGMTLLGSALKFLYEAVLDAPSTELMATYSKHVMQQLSDGKFADPSTQSAFCGIKYLSNEANGTVHLELHKGQAIFLKVETPVVHNVIGLRHADSVPDFASDGVFADGDGSFGDVAWEDRSITQK